MRAKQFPDVGLFTHTKNVVGGCETLLALVGPDLLRMYRISDQAARFHRLLITAAWLHDIGKANNHFQRHLSHNTPQAARHEAVSHVIMREDAVWEWLSAALTEEDFDIVSWVVGGHHRKFPNDLKPTTNPTMTIHLSHPEVGRILQAVGEHLNAPSPPPLQDVVYDVGVGPTKCRACMRGRPCVAGGCSTLPWIGHEFAAVKGEIPEHGHLNREIIACLKSALIMGDVLGSIQDGEWLSVDGDVLQSLSSVFTRQMAKEITQRKMAEVKARRFTPIQELIVKQTARVTLVESGCGTGKTVVAYRWGGQHAHNRKLYFCYPTMGTATAGYDDYLLDFNATLVHGSAKLELADPKRRNGRLERGDVNIAETFRVWSRPIIACTADTVLGLAQNYHLGILGAAAFANGAFVFDEVHGYDEAMWRALLQFLQFDVPCLLMTASLPPHRVAELEKALAEVGDELNHPESRGDHEAAPRYHLPAPASTTASEAFDIAQAAIDRGGRVLWISNTVDRCVDLYEQAVMRGMGAVCHHSRFKARDRAANHDLVIKSFRGLADREIIFATQVAEMSLDVSADVLITDIAPISAMIQRLGRLNRRGESPFATWVNITPSPHPLHDDLYKTSPNAWAPYHGWDIAAAVKWLDELNNNRRGQPRLSRLSQDDLAAAWMSLKWENPPTNHDNILQHLGGVTQTHVGSLRQPTGMTMDVVLEEDREDVERGRIGVDEVKIRLNVNARRSKLAFTPFRNNTFLPPADAIHYTKETGARWLNLNSSG